MELEKSLGNGKIRTLCWRNIMCPKHHILTNKGKLLRTVMLTSFPSKKHKLFQYIHQSIESEVITGKSQTEAFKYWLSDSEVNPSSRDFPVMTKRMRLINKLFIIIMAFSLCTWAGNQLKQTTGQHITLKNMSPQWVVHLSSQYRQVTLVSGYPF